VHHLGSPLPGLLITTGFYPSQSSAVGFWEVASTASVLGLYQVDVDTCCDQQAHRLGLPLPDLLITTGFYPSQP